MSWVTFLPLTLLSVGVGVSYGLLRRRHAAPLSLLHALAFGPGVALGAISIPFFLLRFFDVPVGIVTIPTFAAVLLAFLLLLGRERKEEVFTMGSSGAFLSLLILTPLVLHMLWLFPRVSHDSPMGTFDAWAIWNPHAVFLYRAESGLEETFQLMRQGHPDYPLMLPAAVAAQWTLLGAESLAVPQALSLVFSLALATMVYVAVLRFSSYLMAGMATALLLSVPNFWSWAFSQCADVPLAYFLLASATTLGSQLGPAARRLPGALAGFFLSLLAWTKNEGLVQAGILVLVFTFFFLVTKDRRAVARRCPLIFAGAAPGVLSLLFFKLWWSPTNETIRFLRGGLERLQQKERWTTIASHLWDHLNPFSGHPTWALLWPACVISLLLWWRPHRVREAIEKNFQLVCLALLLVFIFVTYLCSPSPLNWHLQTSLDRLLLQVAPLCIAATLPPLLVRDRDP